MPGELLSYAENILQPSSCFKNLPVPRSHSRYPKPHQSTVLPSRSVAVGTQSLSPRSTTSSSSERTTSSSGQLRLRPPSDLVKRPVPSYHVPHTPPVRSRRTHHPVVQQNIIHSRSEHRTQCYLYDSDVRRYREPSCIRDGGVHRTSRTSADAEYSEKDKKHLPARIKQPCASRHDQREAGWTKGEGERRMFA